jgi:hypothetical protein
MHFPLFRVAENWRQLHGIARADWGSIEASFWIRGIMRLGAKHTNQEHASRWHVQRTTLAATKNNSSDNATLTVEWAFEQV